MSPPASSFSPPHPWTNDLTAAKVIETSGASVNCLGFLQTLCLNPSLHSVNKLSMHLNGSAVPRYLQGNQASKQNTLPGSAQWLKTVYHHLHPTHRMPLTPPSDGSTFMRHTRVWYAHLSLWPCPSPSCSTCRPHSQRVAQPAAYLHPPATQLTLELTQSSILMLCPLALCVRRVYIRLGSVK
jgi:hypothetical protein